MIDHSHEYDENCEGCQPGMIDIHTGMAIPPDDPAMLILRKAFKEECTLDERRAWHRCVMMQSKNEKDLAIMRRVGEKMQQALLKAEENGELS